MSNSIRDTTSMNGRIPHELSKVGTWIPKDDSIADGVMTCSHCNVDIAMMGKYIAKFCPECGWMNYGEGSLNMELNIKIKYENPDIEKLNKIDQGDWIDLRAAEHVEMKAGDFAIISLGVAMQLPEGYEAHIVPRSSTFKKWGILQTNSMGVIDNSYCGDNDIWKFPALAMRDTVVNVGDRICQFRIIKKMEPTEFVEVDHLGNNDRGGFGSTGKT